MVFVIPQITPFATFCVAFHIFLIDGDKDFKFDGWVGRSKS